jgi:hypothetical protein
MSPRRLAFGTGQYSEEAAAAVQIDSILTELAKLTPDERAEAMRVAKFLAGLETFH